MRIKQILFPTWEAFKKVRKNNTAYVQLNNAYWFEINDLNYNEANRKTGIFLRDKVNYNSPYIIRIEVPRVTNEKEYVALCQKGQHEFEKYVTDNFLENN